MLSIRMQRTGRKGHAMFRLVVQDSRYTPTSGKLVEQLGSFDPHTKTARVDSKKATFYLNNGARPSGRAAMLLQKEGVTLPTWVKLSSAKSGSIRNPEKLRRNRSEEKTKEQTEVTAEEKPKETPADDTVAEVRGPDTEEPKPETETAAAE